MSDKQGKEKGINSEKVTKYGEMVPTNFSWLSLEEQKKKADKLANLGKSVSRGCVTVTGLVTAKIIKLLNYTKNS